MAHVPDYIVVGAGAAGCVLAARLSENGSTNVTLLEAGGSNKKLEVYLPAAFSKLFRTERDWAYSTEPEPELAGRKMFWPRGKMLGGSSSMNAMIYIRGTAADYDAWEGLGCKGWGWSDVLPFFRATENNARGASSLHGAEGPMDINEHREVNPLSLAFVEGCVAAGIPKNEDFNGPTQEGAGLYQVNQRKGRRFSAADAYLLPARGRKNLHVETKALATKLIFERGRCVGVEYVKDGKTHRILARREVLLAGGAINSPQLLLASGIGPADELKDLGIEVVADLPGVGKNLQDHLICAMTFACTQKVTLDVAETIPNVLRWLIPGRGPLTSNVAEAGAFFRTKLAGKDPDIQALFAPAWFVDHGFTKPPGCGFSFGPTLLRPESRGELKLRTRDPRDAPRIWARYLTAKKDVDTLVEGVKTLREVAYSKALAPYRGEERTPGDRVKSDAEIAAYLRSGLETLYHPVGTCKMGADADRTAVVDPKLRVRGVEGLRVIDASVMPTIPGGNTQAPTLMIAERAVPLLA